MDFCHIILLLFHHSFFIYVSIPKPVVGFLFCLELYKWNLFFYNFLSHWTLFWSFMVLHAVVVYFWCYTVFWEWIYHKFILFNPFYSWDPLFFPYKMLNEYPCEVFFKMCVYVYFHVYLSKPRIHLLVSYMLHIMCVSAKARIELQLIVYAHI